MKFVEDKKPYSSKSPRFLGKIYSQVDNKWILVGKHQVCKIVDGDVHFYSVKQNRGIGILQIGEYEEDKIHCLEREFREDWEKIIRKICKMCGTTDADEDKIKEILARQPQLPTVAHEKKARPTREQLMTDPRYTQSRIFQELDEFEEDDY